MDSHKGEEQPFNGVRFVGRAFHNQLCHGSNYELVSESVLECYGI